MQLTKSQKEKMIDDIAVLNLQLCYINMLVLRTFIIDDSFNHKVIYEIDVIKERIEKIKTEIKESL